MEPHISNSVDNPGGGDFMNRPHESLLHPILHPETLARFYGKHHEAMVTADAREALDLATRFCRETQVSGLDTQTDAGFDWVLTPSCFSSRITLELGQGGQAVLFQVDPDLSAHQLGAVIHAGVLGHQALASTYASLPTDQRDGLLTEIRESIDQVRLNRSAAKQLQSLRVLPELPVPSQPLLDIAQLLRRFEVPDAQARLAADHVKATYGAELASLHGSQVLAVAHAHSPHLGLYGAPWQTWLCENATTGNLDGVEACLRMTAEPNVPDANGETPLHLAARHGHPGIVRLLIEAGADPALGNARGETSLHVAAHDKHADCCLELIAGGADPGRLDGKGRKPGDSHRDRKNEHGKALGL